VIPTGVEADARGPVAAVEQPPTVVVNIRFRTGPELKDAFDFYRAIGPSVRAEVPGVRFVVASRDSVPIGRVRKDAVGIDVVAATDQRSISHTRAVAVAPPGAGFDLRASVLEPMAAGVPVIVSSGTCARLGAQSGRDVQVADSVTEIKQRLIELLESATRREEIGAQGRALVEAGFSCDTVTARLDQLLAGVLKATSSVEPTAKPLPIAVAPSG
jgi:glycosyltransferase involved in cell wall biosynthesis